MSPGEIVAITLASVALVALVAGWLWHEARLRSAETTLRDLPARIREHDEELAHKIGDEVYDRLSKLMYLRAEAKLLAPLKPEDKE
jgi:hypothetical protein